MTGAMADTLVADTLVQVTAFAATVMGVLFLYLAAPRQQWLDHPWPPLPSRLAGAALLAVGLLQWCTVLHPATALFTSLTVAMTLFILLPFAAALSVLLRRP